MNRELKFRVWNKETKKWIHGPGNEVSLFGEMILLGGFLKGVKCEEINDCLPLQYTGMNDSSQKEIYESDIVEYSLGSGKLIYQDIIAWEHYGWVLLNYDGFENSATPLTYLPEIKVIGNIFDNPDLIRQP